MVIAKARIWTSTGWLLIAIALALTSCSDNADLTRFGVYDECDKSGEYYRRCNLVSECPGDDADFDGCTRFICDHDEEPRSIDPDWLCDGDPDCIDGSDEEFVRCARLPETF